MPSNDLGKPAEAGLINLQLAKHSPRKLPAPISCWSGPNHCSHLGSEQTNAGSLSLPLYIQHLQINKSFKEKTPPKELNSTYQ